jgi:hypothetical protein
VAQMTVLKSLLVTSGRMKKMNKRYQRSIDAIQAAYNELEAAYKHIADLSKRADGTDAFREELRYANLDIKCFQKSLEVAREYSTRVYIEEGLMYHE